MYFSPQFSPQNIALRGDAKLNHCELPCTFLLSAKYSSSSLQSSLYKKGVLHLEDIADLEASVDPFLTTELCWPFARALLPCTASSVALEFGILLTP